MPPTANNFDLDRRYHRFFPLFERYIVNLKRHVDHVTSSTQTFTAQNRIVNALVPTNWSWNTETYNQNYFSTKVTILSRLTDAYTSQCNTSHIALESNFIAFYCLLT